MLSLLNTNETLMKTLAKTGVKGLIIYLYHDIFVPVAVRKLRLYIR